MTSADPTTSQALPRPRRRWKTVLIGLLVFVSGFTAGGASAVMFIAHLVQYDFRHPDEIPSRLTVRLTRRLSLDTRQADQVRAMATDRFAHIEQLRRQFQPRLQQELDGFHDDVRKVLRPDQQLRWDALFNDLVQNWLPKETDVPTTAPSTAPTR